MREFVRFGRIAVLRRRRIMSRLCPHSPLLDRAKRSCSVLQLVLDDSLHFDLEGVEEMIAIHVSFGQSTPFSSELERVHTTSIAYRVVRSLLAKESQMTEEKWESVDCYRTFEELISDVRHGLKSQEHTDQQLGILLCVDETLKVANANPSLCRAMLDELAALQQRSMENCTPTFVLFTGLYYDKVIQEFGSQSSRPLKIVSLPKVVTSSQETIANTISTELVNVAMYDEGFQRRQHDLSREVRRLVLWTCLMTGQHFRTLEESVKRLFAILISEETLTKYKAAVDESSRSVLATSSDFQPNAECHDLSDDGWSDGTVRRSLSNAFMATVKVQLWDKDMFTFCCQLFCRLLDHFDRGFENHFYCEEDEEMIEAGARGVVLITNRNSDQLSQVQPRVSLPHLFNAAPVIWHLERQTAMAMDLNNVELLLGTGGTLPQLLPVLLTNIGIALNGLASNIPAAFEHIMLFVELLRVYVISSSRHPESISLNDILPGAFVVPHATGEIDIEVTSWVTKDCIVPMEQMTLTKRQKKQFQAKELRNGCWRKFVEGQMRRSSCG